MVDQGEDMKAFEASCHCGRQQLVYYTSTEVAGWKVRACQCTFCRRHGAQTTRDPRARVVLRLDESAISRYRFGMNTTDFLLCTECGSYMGAVIEQAGREYMTINTCNFSDDVRALLPRAEPVVYDNEPVDERIRRRIDAWTPVDEGFHEKE